MDDYQQVGALRPFIYMRPRCGASEILWRVKLGIGSSAANQRVSTI